MPAYPAEPPAYGKRVTRADFPVSSEILDAFEAAAGRRENGGFDTARARAARAFVKNRIRYNLVLAARGLLSANQVLIEDDPQTAKAVESLPGAARLAALASEKRRSAQ